MDTVLASQTQPLRLHAYAGRENGLMIIGTQEALANLGRQLQMAGDFPDSSGSTNWPAEVAVITAESPYLDQPDYRVSIHVQRGELPSELLRKTRSGWSLYAALVGAGLALLGAFSLARWIWNAL